MISSPCGPYTPCGENPRMTHDEVLPSQFRNPARTFQRPSRGCRAGVLQPGPTTPSSRCSGKPGGRRPAAPPVLVPRRPLPLGTAGDPDRRRLCAI